MCDRIYPKIPGGSVLYVPKGAAREYSHLAVNLYHGCEFGCKYCYAPAIARKTLKEWSACPYPKKDILKRLKKDAKRMAGDDREILLCYTSDPYQNAEAADITRQALLILEEYGMTVTVLTKGGLAAAADFDILKRNNWKFGTTLSCLTQDVSIRWEPKAATPAKRLHAIVAAHEMGIYTWVSMEPVWARYEAVRLIEVANRYVDFWKIGKMNHRKLDFDWVEFHTAAVRILDRLGCDYYIKKELKAEVEK